MLKIKNIRPVFTGVLTTTDKYENDVVVNGIIQNTAGKVKEYQKVVAVGNMVRNVKEGDLVVIDPSRYSKKRYDDNSLREDIVDNPIVSIDIPIVTMDDKDYFLIQENDISYVITDYEEVPDEKPKAKTIILPKSKVIN